MKGIVRGFNLYQKYLRLPYLNESWLNGDWLSVLEVK